jgi:hypothetical protein
MTAGATPSLLGFNGLPPMFGVVTAAGLNVLWKNGVLTTAIPSTALDKIEPPDDAVADGFIGKRVKVNDPSGYTNWGLCVCVDAYKRDYNDANAPIQVLLLQSPNGEYYLEALSTNCVATD